MRIAVIAESFLPQVNGVTHSVQRILEHLAAGGHEALVLCPAASGEAPTEYAGFPVLGLRSIGLPGYADFHVAGVTGMRMDRILAGFSADVVHLASPFALGYKGAQSARRLGIPLVAVYQTEVPSYAERYGLGQFEPLLWWRVRQLHNLATMTLAPSTFAINQLAEHGIQRVRMWRRGVDSVRFHPAKRSTFWRRSIAGDDTRIIGYLGRLAAEKQVEDLRAVADLPGTRLVIIGYGPKRTELRSLLPDAVFCGQLVGDDLPRALASCDVLVHPGERETFGQSVQEALASGVPVVAPARGGPMDLVSPSRTGWLYPPGDLVAMRRHVLDLVGDELKRRAFAETARLSVEHRTWDAVCAELVQYYHEARRADAVVA